MELDELLDKENTPAKVVEQVNSNADTNDVEEKKIDNTPEKKVYKDPLTDDYVLERNNQRGGPIWEDPNREVFHMMVLKKDF